MSAAPRPYPAGRPIIELLGIHLTLGDTAVLSGVDLSVRCGERLALIGPSGSGKSTLLRCMNGLAVPQRGEMRLFGESVASPDALREARMRIGMIFQGFHLYSHMTVLENVALAPHRLGGLPRARAERLALDHLDALGVADLRGRYPFQLSGGQQQRVALARAFAPAPDILLLDEPTSALDPERVQSVLAAIETATARGITTVTVTHEVGFARRQSHRILFLDRGRIVEEGAPDEILVRPKSERLRLFLDQIIR